MSAIPTAIDRLVTMFGLVGPPVLDGPPVGLWPDMDCIIVGWQRDAGQPDVAGAGARVEHVEGFVSTDQEQFTIACMISVVSGDMTMAPLRTRVFGYYDTIAAAIRGDDTLLGSVARAQLSTASMAQYLYKESGGVVEIAFDVFCIANV